MLPVAVSGLSEVAAAAASGPDGVALRSNGTVMAWGSNSDGQMGNGSSTGPEACDFSFPCSTTPTEVSGFSGVTAIATDDYTCCGGGHGHTLALLSNGTVMAWGDNNNGALGDGTNLQKHEPVAVEGFTTATAV